MKKLLSILCFIPALLLAGCGDDLWVSDTAPIELAITICNENGENLLADSENPAIPLSEIYATYEDEDYPLELPKESRLLPGFFENPVLNNGVIKVGDFTAEINTIYKTVLHIGKKEFNISIDNYYKFKKGGSKIRRKYYLNDELVYGPTESSIGKITITINPEEI